MSNAQANLNQLDFPAQFAVVGGVVVVAADIGGGSVADYTYYPIVPVVGHVAADAGAPNAEIADAVAGTAVAPAVVIIGDAMSAVDDDALASSVWLV